MSDKCTSCEGTGLVCNPDNTEVIEMLNCPDCHGLGRVGE